MKVHSRIAAIVALTATLLTLRCHAQQPAIQPSLQTNEPFSYGLQLRSGTFNAYITSLVVSDEEKRAAELQVLNQSGFTTLLGYTRFIPMRWQPEVDTFFLQNYMRPDLNPPVGDDKLFKSVRRAPRITVGLER